MDNLSQQSIAPAPAVSLQLSSTMDQLMGLMLMDGSSSHMAATAQQQQQQPGGLYSLPSATTAATPSSLPPPSAASSQPALSYTAAAGAEQFAQAALAGTGSAATTSSRNLLVTLPAGFLATSRSPTAAFPGHDAAPVKEGDCPLARGLGVRLSSLLRLFTADETDEFSQPVWMVVNLQGKIKGSYTADKMADFCRRGTLSSKQLVLGMDRNLPYLLRQQLAYYRHLGDLALAVEQGAHYVPLTCAHVVSQPDGSLAAPHWTALAQERPPPASQAFQGAAAGLATSSSSSASSASSSAPPAAAAASLRQALQRLLGVAAVPPSAGSGPDPVAEVSLAPGPSERNVVAGAPACAAAAGGAAGERQPLWLYINHLGWCRGPFSGGKLMHAHLCGRLPRDTLVAAYDPAVPTFKVSADVAAWFRPLGALLDNMRGGWAYAPVGWAHVLEREAGRPCSWQPLVPCGPGPAAPLLHASAVLQPPAVPSSLSRPVGPRPMRGALPVGGGNSSSSSSSSAWMGPVNRRPDARPVTLMQGDMAAAALSHGLYPTMPVSNVSSPLLINGPQMLDASAASWVPLSQGYPAPQVGGLLLVGPGGMAGQPLVVYNSNSNSTIPGSMLCSASQLVDVSRSGQAMAVYPSHLGPMLPSAAVVHNAVAPAPPQQMIHVAVQPQPQDGSVQAGMALSGVHAGVYQPGWAALNTAVYSHAAAGAGYPQGCLHR